MPEIILQRQKVTGFYLVMAGKPCLGLRDGIIAQILSVFDTAISLRSSQRISSANSLMTSGTGIDATSCCICRNSSNVIVAEICPKAPVCLFFKTARRVPPILYIGRHDLQFQAVIQRFQDLFLRIVEIRDLIGGRKKKK